MKFLNIFAESTLRYFFLILTFFALILSIYNFTDLALINRMTNDDCLWTDHYDLNKQYDGMEITNVVPGGNADKAGIKNNDLLIAIDGKQFKTTWEAQGILNAKENKSYAEYTIVRNGQLFKAIIYVYKFFNVFLITNFLLAVGFLLNGILVGYSRPKILTSQLFFFLCLSVCLSSIGLEMTGYNISYVNYLAYVKGIASAISLPLLLHFFLTFPYRYEFKLRKALLITLYSLSGLVILVKPTAITSAFQISLLIIFNLICAILLIFSYERVKDESLKKSVKTMLKGYAIGFASIIYLLIITVYFQRANFLVNPFWFLPMILILAIPISMGVAIFKYRILDTEFIIKRSLVFGILTFLIAAFYLILVYIADSIFDKYLGFNKKLITFGAIVVITFTFDFFNKKIRNFVEKQFYKNRYDYRKALLSFSSELPKILSVYELIMSLKKNITDIAGVTNLGVWLKDDRYSDLLRKEMAWKKTPEEKKLDEDYILFMDKIYRENNKIVFLHEGNMNDLGLNSADKEVIRSKDLKVSVPVILKDKLIGALNFSSKKSGKPYSEEDIDLLRTIASQTAISLESSRLKNEEYEKQKIDEELLVAERIQSGLMPDVNTTMEGLDISVLSKPARTIGGDFFDLIKLDGNRLLVVVADVSGKGIPAALNMAKVQAMLRFAAKVFDSPASILRSVNKQIFRRIEKKSFVTVIAAMFDLDNKSVKICRAGHNPLLYSNNGSIEILNNKGIGLGLDNANLFDMNLEETEMKLNSENLYLFYSDGLTEAMNESKNEFGVENVISLLSKFRNFSSKEIRDALIKNVSEFRANAVQNDDITLVAVKVTG
ncbi:hypothetical protein BH10BAC5_BH10BAC5_04410 [soil metagenome]